MFDRVKDGLWWDRALTLVEGCAPMSPGCDHCWSAVMAHRFHKTVGEDWQSEVFQTDENGRFNGNIQSREDRLDLPLKVKKPTAWAIWNDLFHEAVPFDFQLYAMANFEEASRHIFIVLTKRPHIARMFFESLYKNRTSLIKNIWLGATAENQEMVDERIPILLKIPAAVRFVSVEPMLGPVDLWGAKYPAPGGGLQGAVTSWPGGLDWVICGGESGSKARPMHPDWARSLRDQCKAAGVPFLFKDWGEWSPDCFCGDPMRTQPHRSVKRPDSGIQGVMFRCGKKAAGRLLDGRQWLELPNF